MRKSTKRKKTQRRKNTQSCNSCVVAHSSALTYLVFTLVNYSCSEDVQQADASSEAGPADWPAAAAGESWHKGAGRRLQSLALIHYMVP